jgi:hypothetical protein
MLSMSQQWGSSIGFPAHAQAIVVASNLELRFLQCRDMRQQVQQLFFIQLGCQMRPYTKRRKIVAKTIKQIQLY